MTRASLKVFDFDVARVLPDDSLPSTSALYKLTRRVGSPRYMSPECARGDLYNCKADVYTMGLLCFELLSLQKPYHDISAEDHDEQIFLRGVRPKLPIIVSSNKAIHAAASASRKLSKMNNSTSTPSSKKSLPAKQPHVQFWNHSMQSLVRRMWNEDIAQRPTMKEARMALETESFQLQQQLDDLRRQLEQVEYNEAVKQSLQQHQQHSSLQGLDNCNSIQHMQQPSKSTTANASLSKRPFSLRLWKSSNNHSSSSNQMNGCRHNGIRVRANSSGGGSLLGTTRHTSTSTTGLSCNFASFGNLAALNEQR